MKMSIHAKSSEEPGVVIGSMYLSFLEENLKEMRVFDERNNTLIIFKRKK